jgi:23S rRNA pseudouridine2605 synthase
MEQDDEQPTLLDYVHNRDERLYHVGRLDADTEGLIMLTNDGELANRLAHPRWAVTKTYVATVEGQIGRGVGRQLRQGVELTDGLAAVDGFKVIDAVPGYSMIELQLHMGRNRIVRRLMAAVGHPVTQLVRTAIGPIRLGDLKSGRTRVVAGAERASLKKAVGL